MSEYLDEFLDRALLNNTYNYEALHQTLNNSLMSSFSYLYEAQRALVNYTELFYTSSDTESRLVDRIGHLYLDNLNHVYFDMDYDLIDYDVREAYRMSEYYEEDISLKDIAFNPNIFKKTPIVQIDGETIWDFKIHCNEDGTTFKLPHSFGRSFVLSNDRNIYYQICDESEEGALLVVDDQYLEDHGLIYNYKTMRKIEVVTPKLKEGTVEPGDHVLYFDLPIYKDHKITVLCIDNDTYYRIKYGAPRNTTSGIGLNINMRTLTIPKNRLWFDYSNFSYYVVESTTLLHKDISSRIIDQETYPSAEAATAVARSMNLLEGVYISYKSVVEDIYAYYTVKWTTKYKVASYADLTNAQKASMRKAVFTSFVDMRIADVGQLMCSIHSLYEGDANPLGSELIPLTDNGEYYTANITEKTARIANSTNTLYVSYIFFRNLLEYKDYEGNNIITVDSNSEGKYFAKELVLADEHRPIYKNPVPVENMIIFKMDGSTGDSYNIIPNEKNISLQYPYSYKINNENLTGTDTFRVFYFYDGLNSNNVAYRNIFEFWYRFLVNTFSYEGSNSLDAIINAYQYDLLTYPEDWTESMIEDFKSSYSIVDSYQYKKWYFGDSDYLSRYLPSAEEGKESPIIYKDLKMREFETYDEEVLRKYVLNENKLGKSFYMYTNTIDLSTRVRRDTSEEFETSIVYFNEDRYVFAINNDSKYPYLVNARFFVDGILISDVVQLRKNYLDYFYIPCNMCTDDSFIEIEVFPDYEYTIDLTFDSMDDKYEIDSVNEYELLPVINIHLSEDRTYATDVDGVVIAPIPGLIYYDYEGDYDYAVDGLYTWKPSKLNANMGHFIPYKGPVKYVVDDTVLGDDYNSEKMVHNATVDFNRLRKRWEGGMYTYPFMDVIANALIGSLRGPFEYIDDDGNVVPGEFATNAKINQSGSMVNSFVKYRRIRPDDAFPNFMDLTLVGQNDDPDVGPSPEPEPEKELYPITEYDGSHGGVYSEFIFYKRSDFNFSKITEYKDIDFEETEGEEAVKHVPLERFYISPANPDVLGNPIEIGFHKNSYRMEIIVDEEGYPYIEIPYMDWCHHIDYLRIYHNGRFIPKNMYQLHTSFDHARLVILDWCAVGDLLFVDITPYRYREVPLTEDMYTLKEGELLLDLSTVINKPFDIRYYDIYLNGRKLSRNNVMKVTPWQITLVNLKSIYNLRIYERDRDWEFYGLDYSEPIYTYTFDNFINESFVSEDDKKEILKTLIDEQKDSQLNIVPNTNDEEKMDYDTEDTEYIIPYLFYYSELIPKTYSHPDYLQLNKEIMLSSYNLIHQTYLVEPARTKQPEIIMLDPDKIIPGEEDNILVYCVGHIEDDVDQEILDMEVDMPE